jgi:acetyltransferase-like isoleucine patch superfamily enzyme
MVLTGSHQFSNGKRISLAHNSNNASDLPLSGYDIYIGDGSWVSSGAILTAKARIGKLSIVCAGAVVTKPFVDHAIVAG